MYQIAHFHKLPEANDWLQENPNIEIVELKTFYTPYGAFVVTLLYKIELEPVTVK